LIGALRTATIAKTGIKQGGIVMGVTPRSDEDAEYLEHEWKNSGEHVYR
jgi:hypothetical protein